MLYFRRMSQIVLAKVTFKITLKVTGIGAIR